MKLRVLTILLLSVLLAACTMGAKPTTVKEPAVPAIPGRLFFESPTTVTMLESGKRTTLALPAGTQNVALAPNGQSLAVVAREEDGTHMLLMPVHGAPKQLFATDGRAQPIWSADSTRLAIRRSRSVRIWSVRDGAGVTVPIPAGSPEVVSWSPNGKYLAVATMNGSSLWLIDVATGVGTLVEAPARMGAWAPDGTHFVYRQHPDSKGDSVVLAEPGKPGSTIFSQEKLLAARPDLATLFGTNVLQGGYLTWAPSGKSVFFVFKAAGPDNPRYALATFGPDGSNVRALVLPVHPEANKEFHPPRPCQPTDPRFVAGGSEIVLTLDGPGCNNQVLRLNATTLEQVGEPVREGIHAQVSPDGSWSLVLGETVDRVTLFPVQDRGRRTSLSVQGRFLAWLP